MTAATTDALRCQQRGNPVLDANPFLDEMLTLTMRAGIGAEFQSNHPSVTVSQWGETIVGRRQASFVANF
jgi:hypothetical protein